MVVGSPLTSLLCLGAVGPIRSQGNCASCYALVAAQAIEATEFFKVLVNRTDFEAETAE